MTGYATFITQLGAIGPYIVTDAASATPFQDPNVNNILAQAIAYAEGRIYREPEFDFLALHTTNTDNSTVAGNRNLAMPSQILITESLNIVIPAGASVDAAGSYRKSLQRVTLDYLDFVALSMTTANTDVPQYYAIYDTSNVRLAPTPNAAYVAEFVGTFTPDPLSASNPDTFLTTYLNDLFFAAAMIFVSGYQRNFGAQSDDPRMAVSWESAYQGLKSGAAVNEARKHSRGPQFQPDPPMPLAQPPGAPGAPR